MPPNEMLAQAGEATSPPWLTRPAHFVQFYESDAFLARSLAEFIAAGLQAGSAAVVIATPAHRDGLETILAAKGFDLENLKAAELYYVLDAAETLAEISSDGRPDAERFREVVGSVIARAAHHRPPVRAFGEMVALLWADGKVRAALELEQLWDDLAKCCSFALCCAYPIGAFRREHDAAPFMQICGAHSQVVPAESYREQDVGRDERLRTIALLQQKAVSLEAEIARRRAAEKILEREKQELSDFLENASEAIHKVAADGTILWANRAELEFLGYEEREYIGRHIAEFHADPETIEDILRRLERGEKLHDYEARLKHKDGSVRYVSINSSVYREQDQFVYTKCFTRDITERKCAAELLEKTVVERTAKLNEVVGELEAFSYTVSHDLRAPLRAMQGYARSIIEDYGGSVDAEAVYRLKRIDIAATRLSLLVEDILAYSRTAKGEMHMEPVGLEAVVRQLLDEHPAIEKMRDCIRLGKLCPVMGHATYVAQCLANLVENALKFVAPGRAPQIEIGSEEIGDNVRIYVRDNGIGIDPIHRERLFDMFSRIHPVTKYEGTGIGLAIVKKAVMRMNGDLGFESEPGRGSTFWFILPKVAHV